MGLSLPPNAYAVALAIANVNGSILINEDAVGAGQQALPWIISVRSITDFAIAYQ
jgi:hypothetical protein